MKKAIILSLLAAMSIATQAQVQKRVRAISPSIMQSTPKATINKKTKLSTIEWPSTENNSWHENIGILKDVPTADVTQYFSRIIDFDKGYVPMRWALIDEGDNTVLHCYLPMTADVVTNLWLGGAETTILDKATGTIYQAISTVPAECYDKVFGVKGKSGTSLDLQIVFPRLPSMAQELRIYGVPNWFMRGWDLQEFNICQDDMQDYDTVPQFHKANMVRDSLNYDRNNHESWAVYNDPHLIKPIEENKMALWRTRDVTYLAIATEQNWLREYYGRGGDCMLLDQRGRQYKCRGVVDYPNDRLFWLEGYPGDYFAIVLMFDPLPTSVDNITYVAPEGEPFNMWGADWSGEMIPDLSVEQLRKNQPLFEYHKRKVVK